MIYNYTKIGSFHQKKRLENQDSVLGIENEICSVVALADGVSSCREGKTGAEITCKALVNFLIKKGPYLMRFNKNVIKTLVISSILNELRKVAKEKMISIDDLSSTFAVIIYDKIAKKVMILSLGDSMVLGIKNNNVKVLIYPSDSREGCYVTTTRSADTVMKIMILRSDTFNEYKIFSDGAWKILFNNSAFNQNYKKYNKNGNIENSSLVEFFTDYQNVDDCSFSALKIM